MNEKIVSQPLALILRDFCHVEWFEIEDLKNAINGGAPGFKIDTGLLKNQFDQLLSEDEVPFEEINSLTLNEFESTSEAKDWLLKIYKKVFLDK